MRALIVGDIYHRTDLGDKIDACAKADHVVFLGDYLTN